MKQVCWAESGWTVELVSNGTRAYAAENRTHAERCTLFYLQFKITLLLRELALNAADFMLQLSPWSLQAPNQCKYIQQIYEYAMKCFEASHCFALRTLWISCCHVSLVWSIVWKRNKLRLNEQINGNCVLTCFSIATLTLCGGQHPSEWFFPFSFSFRKWCRKSIRITCAFMSTTWIVTARLRQS